MLIELHCHTNRYSACSFLEPVEAVQRAAAMGLAGLVITEHEHLWEDGELGALLTEAEVHEGFVLLAGQEVDTDLGHVLVYGAGCSLPGRWTLDELRAAWPDAALVWAHPYRHGREPEEDRLTHRLLDGVEIFNSNHTGLAHYRGIADWHRLKFVATAGSDAHILHATGRFPTQLDHPVCTTAELVTELRAGRCRPFYKEIPRAGATETVTEIIVGTKGADEHRERLIVRQIKGARSWRRLKRAVDVIGGLAHRGFVEGLFRVPRMLEANPEEQILVEESQRGKGLFDLVTTVSADTGRRNLLLAARWLGALHGAGLVVGSPEATWKREQKRFRSYGRSFHKTHNPRRGEVDELLGLVAEAEQTTLTSGDVAPVQCHGDFHPKNIILGQDLAHDPDTLYVSVIDFAGSLVHHPAFDLGTFYAQLDYQLRDHPDALELVSRSELLTAYCEQLASVGGEPAPDLAEQLPLFELRALLSIASYLVKVGKGESPDMTVLLDRAGVLAAKCGGDGFPPSPHD